MKFTPSDGFPYYFDLVKDEKVFSLFSSDSTINILKAINDEKAAHRYEPNKWSVKQVVGHITDHERIKMFRAFQLSRNENVQLWGYDQDLLVKNSRFDDLKIEFLVSDFRNVRAASLSFIQSLSEEQLKRKGSARQYEITLEDFLKSIIGHERHHLEIIKEKYL